MVLFVDDEQEFLDLICPRIRKWGYDVIGITEGFKAIEYLKNNRPDLILLDLGLQDISGFKILLEAKTRYPDICVWIISAFNDQDLKKQAKELKADDFIVKPFLPSDLKEKLIDHFKNKRNPQ